MKLAYEVLWTETAEQDLNRIIQYIADKNPPAGMKLLESMQFQARQLEHFPERCRIVPELAENGITGYRELILENWRVMFKISDAKIFILAVLDSRRNLEDLLLERWAPK